MRITRMLMVVWSISLVFTACGEGVLPSDVTTEINKLSAIQGTNDLMPVSRNGKSAVSPHTGREIPLEAKYQAAVQAIGHLDRGCTGTHIGNNLILTAGHCVTVDRTGAPTCSFLDITFTFSKSGATQRKLRGQCEEVLAYAYETNAQNLPVADYAIYRVNNAPAAKIDANASVSQRDLQQLTVFSHPGGRAMEWSGLCKGEFYVDGLITYACDTEEGSSGAPVIDTKSMTVVGVHSWGDDNFANGGMHMGGVLNHITSRGGPNFLADLAGQPMEFADLSSESSKTLTVLNSSVYGDLVKVNLDIDLPQAHNGSCGGTYVLVKTARGDQSQRLCGSNEIVLEGLVTPVAIQYITDGSATQDAAKSVKVDAVELDTTAGGFRVEVL